MRLPKIKIQRFMVAVVFLAIGLWAGRILVPEMVVRWQNCHRAALMYQRVSSDQSKAASLCSNPARVTYYRAKADLYAQKSGKYRRALYVPWECWSLGDSAGAQEW